MANNQGVSLYASDPGRKGVWVLPAGIQIPSEIKLYQDGPNHLMIVPATTMPLMTFVGLRANEWNILLFYTKAWIQHVQTMADREDREDDAFVDMLNDSLRLQDICGKIEDRLA